MGARVGGRTPVRADPQGSPDTSAFDAKDMADLAALSVRAIRNIEAGQVRRPHEETIRLLANVLRLTEQQRAEFLAAAGRTALLVRAISEVPEPERLGPPRTGLLIGREVQVELLTDMVSTAAGQVVSVVGLGGVGKTWLAAEVVRRADLGRVIWLPAEAVRSKWSPAAGSRARAGKLIRSPERLTVELRTLFGSGDSVLVLDGAERGDEQVLGELPEQPVMSVAASNGCSVAARLALSCTERVDRLVPAWPATAADPKVDKWTRRRLVELGATEHITMDLLRWGAAWCVRHGVAAQGTEQVLLGLPPCAPAEWRTVIGGRMSEEGRLFGQILRDHRTRRRLTQKDMADLAALSVRAIRNLEAGRVHRPHEETIRLLADVLRLTAHQRAEFLAAAGRTALLIRATAEMPKPERLGLPRTGLLVGREIQVELLTDMASTAAGQVVSVVGLGGVGKTWLVAEVVHRMDPARVVWLPAEAVRPKRSSTADIRARAGTLIRSPERHTAELQALFGGRDSVLVLDGAERGDEHVLGELLDRFPGTRVLSTSREPLDTEKELVLPLPGLDVEHASQVLLSQLRRVRPNVDDHGAVAELCGLLDGLPAALRWAATLCTVRSPRQIVSHMRGFGLAAWWSVAGEGAALLEPIRHALRQLTPRRLGFLRRIAVLTGLWSADECAAAARLSLADTAVLMDELLTLGLVRIVGGEDEPRFEVLHLVRAVVDGVDVRPLVLRSGTSA